MKHGASDNSAARAGRSSKLTSACQRRLQVLAACFALLAVLISGCSQLTDIWSQPIGPVVSEKSAGTSLRARAAGRVREIWNTPIASLVPVSGPTDFGDPTLASAAMDLWDTPVYSLADPFTDAVVETWESPFFWQTGPPPEFIDPTPYRHWANEIDYPDVHTAPPKAELFMAEPRRLRNRQKDEIWDMPLEQAIQIALSNSHIIRSSGQFLSPANSLLNSPDFVPSSFDPAIQESGVLFGQRGVEAALSEFDTQFTTTMVWGRDERIQNTAVGTGVPPGSTLAQETAAFSTSLTKRLATGGIIGVIHDWNYQGSNNNDFSVLSGPLLFPSSYTGRVRVEARQPLWAGAGTEYTRIAGPVTDQIQGVTGVQQGVVIARINNDIELTQFEAAIRDLLRDVETLYWQLYLAYQTFDAEMSLLVEAVDSYRGIVELIEAESPFAGALEEAEAKEFVYQMQARVDLARDNLYDIEAQLRRVIGLTVTDGKVIRPLDEPTLAEFVPDWYIMLGDALAHRVEIRRQKWNIKQLELQHKAAEHLVKPRLDLVAAYQVNAFGDDLLGNTRDGTTARGFGSAYESLTRGDETGWQVGVEFSLPIGLRFAHAQSRNLELQLAKAHAALGEAEKEVQHELARAFRELDRTYLAMANNLNRRLTAVDRVAAVEALRLREPERFTADTILRAKDQLNQIEQQYLQSLIEYNIALMELHYRGGTLLAINNVHLSEGPWHAEAEYDVLDRQYDRWNTIPTETMLHTEPAPFATHEAPAPIGPPAEHYGPGVHGWQDGVEANPVPDGNRRWQLDGSPPAFLPPPTTDMPSGGVDRALDRQDVLMQNSAALR